MAFKSVTKDAKKATPKRSSTSKKAVAAAPAQRQAKVDPVKKEKERLAYLEEHFCPEGLDYLYDKLGLDLRDREEFDINELKNIAGGRVTKPHEAVVYPLAYDSESGKNMPAAPIKIVASFRIVMPYDKKTFKPVPPSKDHVPNIKAMPCYDYCQKADEIEKFQSRPPRRDAEIVENVKFTNVQKMALEGLGISRERLYRNAYHEIPASVQSDILAGKPFDVNGTVKIQGSSDSLYHFINVNGKAVLETKEDGSVSVDFSPQYPVEKKENMILDIVEVHNVGNVELDVFSRNEDGKLVTNINKENITTLQGDDIMKYNHSFGPVAGLKHTLKKNDKGFLQDHVETDMYQVSVVNGGLYATPMASEKSAVTGETVYVVNSCPGLKDGVLKVGNQELKFETEKDVDDYRRGLGGKVLGYEGWEVVNNKRVDVKYDAFVIPDNRRGGYPKVFTKKQSEELLARRGQVQTQAKKEVKKQNFSTRKTSLGF